MPSYHHHSKREPVVPARSAKRTPDPAGIAALQRSIGNRAVVQLLRSYAGEDEERSPVLDIVGRGGGQPLEPDVRSRMEAGLGTDLSDVRVHAGGTASASAAAVQAHAYTVGNEIVFGDGRYQPGTVHGDRLLAHELTHVVQQRRGPVDGTPTGGGISVSDPSDRFERAAEANADRLLSTGVQRDAILPAAGGGTPQSVVVQRIPIQSGSEEEPDWDSLDSNIGNMLDAAVKVDGLEARKVQTGGVLVSSRFPIVNIAAIDRTISFWSKSDEIKGEADYNDEAVPATKPKPRPAETNLSWEGFDWKNDLNWFGRDFKKDGLPTRSEVLKKQLRQLEG